jgi:hypothetical protein
VRFEPYSVTRHFEEWFIIGDTEEFREARREQERLGLGYRVQIRGGGMPGCRYQRGTVKLEISVTSVESRLRPFVIDRTLAINHDAGYFDR